jgi:sensor histidine kinase YesM
VESDAGTLIPSNFFYCIYKRILYFVYFILIFLFIFCFNFIIILFSVVFFVISLFIRVLALILDILVYLHHGFRCAVRGFVNPERIDTTG